MSTLTQGERGPRVVAETVQRRWRLAALLGLVVLLALAALVIVQVQQSAQANRTVAVLKAVRDIRAGATIGDDDLGVANLKFDDPAILDSLVGAGERGHLVGKVAIASVRAGGLIPAGLGAPPASVGMWEVPLAVKRMPPGLKAGDHVALVVNTTAKSGEPVVVVAMQDVRVLEVRQDSVVLWLPAAQAPQVIWYADRGGGIVLVRTQPGAVQQNLPAGGPR